MPEFILDMGSPEGARKYNELPAFVQGYIECAFFTSTGNLEDEDLESASFVELAPDAIQKAIADCIAFQTECADLLALAYERDDYSEVQAGRDFWYTRNGHGVGFWDRKQLDAGGLGDKLSEKCRRSECYLYRGDDKQIYLG